MALSRVAGAWPGMICVLLSRPLAFPYSAECTPERSHAMLTTLLTWWAELR